MVIQHNIAALNAHRFMGQNNTGINKNLEKLSSGYKVNRAADDAAGLAISEKMRGQVRGLGMAEQNTSQGINLIQTAEGGLNETHAILQRMRELSVQSSNGTYQEEDRQQLTKEFEALKSEVDRISSSTHYNNIKLLNGNLTNNAVGNVTTDPNAIMKGSFVTGSGVSFADGATAVINAGTVAEGTPAVASKGEYGISTFTMDSGDATAGGGTLKFTFGGNTYETEVITASKNANEMATIFANAISNSAGYKAGNTDFVVSTDGANLVITAKSGGANSTLDTHIATGLGTVSKGTGLTASTEPTANGVANDVAGADAVDPSLTGATINGKAATATYDKGTNSFLVVDDLGNQARLDASKMKGGNSYEAAVTFSQGENLVFQIGANGGQDQRVFLNVEDMSAKNIGYRVGDKLSDGSLATENAMLDVASIDTIDNANKSIEIITSATLQVAGQRAELGALQNRLESTMNSLGVTKENLTAAESTIRDTDMAKEMMEFTKNNILVQASQAMLAQANQLPQGVLQLLR